MSARIKVANALINAGWRIVPPGHGRKFMQWEAYAVSDSEVEAGGTREDIEEHVWIHAPTLGQALDLATEQYPSYQHHFLESSSDHSRARGHLCGQDHTR